MSAGKKKRAKGAEKKKREKKKKEKEALAAEMERLKARTDGVMDRVGVASQGCVCLACAFEIE